MLHTHTQTRNAALRKEMPNSHSWSSLQGFKFQTIFGTISSNGHTFICVCSTLLNDCLCEWEGVIVRNWDDDAERLRSIGHGRRRGSVKIRAKGPQGEGSSINIIITWLHNACIHQSASSSKLRHHHLMMVNRARDLFFSVCVSGSMAKKLKN